MDLESDAPAYNRGCCAERKDGRILGSSNYYDFKIVSLFNYIKNMQKGNMEHFGIDKVSL